MKGVIPMTAAAPATPTRTQSPGLEKIIVPSARDRWRSATSKQYTPDKVESVLRGSFTGSFTAQWELFDLMQDTSPRLATNVGKLVRAVKGMEWTIQAWSKKGQKPTNTAQERADLVDEIIWSMRPRPQADENDFEATIGDIMDGWFKGTSILENYWMQDASQARWRATKWIHPRYYGYDSFNSDLMLNYQEMLSARQTAAMGTPSAEALFDLNSLKKSGSGQYVEFPEHKFLIAIAKAKTGHPSGTALLRSLAWWWAAANFGAEWLLNHAQLFGQPIRWVNYDSSRPDLLAAICDMLENMGSSGWGAFPAGTVLQLVEAAKAGSDNPQKMLLDLFDRICDILLLGQTLTTDVKETGSRALGDVHSDVEAGIRLAAAEWVASVLNNQLVPSLCILNYGNDDECPWFSPALKKASDPKALAERDKLLVEMGLPIPQQFLYERHNVPAPQAGEPVITKTASTSADLKDAVDAPTTAKAFLAKDPTNKVVDAALEDLTGVEAKWLSGVKPFFVQLYKAAQNPKISDQEFDAMLTKAQHEVASLFPHIDAKAVEDSMFTAMSAGAVNGVVEGFMNRRLKNTRSPISDSRGGAA